VGYRCGEAEGFEGWFGAGCWVCRLTQVELYNWSSLEPPLANEPIEIEVEMQAEMQAEMRHAMVIRQLAQWADADVT